MNALRNNIAIGLLACIPLLAACDRQQQSTAPPKAGEPTSMLGNIVKNATDEARKKLETENISISDGMHIQINGHSIDRPSGKTKAEITPQGDLLLQGTAVAVTPAQRELLLQYRQHIIHIAEAGMDIGVQGADLGMKAASEAISGIFNGNADKVEERIKPETQKIEAAAEQLCDRLPPMLVTQKALAASLPAFRPYATMTDADISDCKNHHKGAGAVAFSHADIGSEIRDEIRDNVRGAAESAQNDEASRADAAATQKSPSPL
ncbi:hypothetical protein [Cognatiluteimonas profundi]|uniref:hypothetical protein n=1 Tax=Cognatiluteimonas profundi TaxID=2594501 RepID=UPI001E30B85E|nr:hypothetical protein [Lysobacter profundi]